MTNPLPYYYTAWRNKLMQEWQEDMKYFRWLNIKYLFKGEEISSNSRRIMGIIKENVAGLQIKRVEKGDGRKIRWHEKEAK